jgi:transcriptional regulator with XRE-family HTH domain
MSPDPAANLGRAIHLRRVELGMKRRDLAIAAGLSYPYVSEIENGHKEPSAKALRQLADALDLAPVELVALTDRVGGSDSSSVLFDDQTSGRFQQTTTLRLPSARPDESPRHVSDDDTVDARILDAVRPAVTAVLASWLERELPAIVHKAVAAELDRRADP